MNIQIHAQDFTLTEGLREHVARRLAFALNHGRDRVSRIVVRLSDVIHVMANKRLIAELPNTGDYTKISERVMTTIISSSSKTTCPQT